MLCGCQLVRTISRRQCVQEVPATYFAAQFTALPPVSHPRRPVGSSIADGSDLPTLLKAVMKLLPLDETCAPASLMEMVSVASLGDMSVS